MDPIQRKSPIISIGGLGEVSCWEVWLAQTEDDIVDDVEGDLHVALLLPLDQQQVDYAFDLPPVLQNVIGMVLEDTL